MGNNNNESYLINKKILSAGTKSAPFKDGTKIIFHYETKKVGGDKVIDDSRTMGPGKPMELILGKKFKLEVWEVILQKMSVNEVALFTVDKTLVTQYPFVSRELRNAHRPAGERRSHCCAMAIQNEGVGYDDLNELLNQPSDLQFIIEILSIIQPGEYERDTWQMSEEEKLDNIQILRDKGNDLYKNKMYLEASDQYAKAIGTLEQLMLKEKPKDTEWLELQRMKLPLLLNYSQCKLVLEDYYAVITHCSEVLEADPDNVKALFRRGRAYLEVWDPEPSRLDFLKAADLDVTLEKKVQSYCKEIDALKRQKDIDDKIKLQKLF